jgi:hypothetical protein
MSVTCHEGHMTQKAGVCRSLLGGGVGEGGLDVASPTPTTTELRRR